MVFDFTALALLFFYAIAGLTRGLMAQLIGLLGMAAVWFLAPPFAPVFRRLIFSTEHRGAPHIEIASLLIAGAVILIAVKVVVSFIPDTLRRWSEGVRRLDNTLGTVLGLVRGVVTVYLLACALIYVEAPLSRRYQELDKAFAESRVMEEVRPNNLLTTLSFQDLERLSEALASWGSARTPQEDPQAARRAERLRGLAGFRSAARDPELRRLARELRYSELLEHPKVQQLLADSDVLEALGQAGGAFDRPASDGEPQGREPADRPQPRTEKARPQRPTAEKATPRRPLAEKPQKRTKMRSPQKPAGGRTSPGDAEPPPQDRMDPGGSEGVEEEAMEDLDP